MQKLKKITSGSAVIWLFSVVMVFIFPRQKYLALSTVFAVLFWISLLTTCVLACLLISNILILKKQKRENQRSGNPLNRPKNAGETAPDSNMANQNSSEER